MNAIRLLCCLTVLTAVLHAASAAPWAQPVTTSAQAIDRAQPADGEDGRQAMEVLQQLLGAYSQGKPRLAEDFLEPQMTGYSRIADALRETAQTQKQLRIDLSDTRTLVSKDVVIIRSRWEKRFLTTAALKPQVRAGNSTFVIHRYEGTWRLSAMRGDNLFSAD